MMLVYRFEGTSGKGPYTDPKCEKQLNKHRFGFHKRAHPAPYRDISDRKLRELVLVGATRYFACSSIDQLMCWWYNDATNADLEKVGATIVVYSVPDRYVAVGKKQVAFLKEHSEKVDTIKISDVVSALYYSNS